MYRLRYGICASFAGTITKLNESTDYISGENGGNEVLGLFNIHNSDGTINFRDGLLLAEAMKYSVSRLASKKKIRFKYKIVDLKGENRNTVNLLTTFTDLKFAAIISATELHQTYFAAKLYSGDTYNIPIYSTIASSSYFDYAKKSGKATNVFQMLPNEEYEAKAIVDILLKLKWSYVSVVSSDDSFMQRAVDSFLSMAQNGYICIGARITLPSGVDDQVSSEQLDSLYQYTRAKVIVLFTPPHVTKRILNALGDHTSFHLISGTSWQATLTALGGGLSAAIGSMLLQYRNTQDEEFNNYFMNLTLHSFKSNKWFEEFWEETFYCQARAAVNKNATRPNCTGFEALQGRAELTHSIVKPTIVALESIACTVQCVGKSKCHWCMHHKDLFHKCITAYFREFQSRCNCADYRSLLGLKQPNIDSFEILNFNGNDYVNVGLWLFNKTSNTSYLDMNVSAVTWKRDEKPESFCYKPCLLGEIEQRDSTDNKCCYDCKKCQINEIASNGSCLACPLHTAPNPTMDKCIPLPQIFLDEKTKSATALKVFSFIGIALNTAIVAAISKYWNTKIIKATGRELIVAILIALYMCFSSPLVFLIRPSLLVCGIQRFILGLSSTACYTPLLLKTTRIHRIFTASHKMSLRPSLVSAKSQIMLCLGLFSVQLLLGAVWIVSNIPEIAFYDMSNKRETAVLCKLQTVSIVFNLIPCLILMAACTFYGYKTRNFPSNFNEAHSISITMYISCFLWGIFIPLLFLFESDGLQVFNHVFLIASFMLLIGYVTQIGLFGAKIAKVCNWKRIGSSAKQSQFFFARNDSGRKSFDTGCSQLTSTHLPCVFGHQDAKENNRCHSFGRYISFHEEKFAGLRPRTSRATRNRSGSF